MSTDSASINTSSEIASVVVLPIGDTSGQAVVLADVRWGEYAALRNKPANAGLRMTYTDGVLEIMTLSSFHELISILIHDFILEWRVHHQIPVLPGGSMTLRRESLLRGLEGDQSYYIEHEAQVRGVAKIDMETAPPPDLIIEVEHTSSSVGKMPIYAKLGVPEVWRFKNETLTIHRLEKDAYVEKSASEALPDFPFDLLRAALSRRNEVNETTLVTEFRKALQAT